MTTSALATLPSHAGYFDHEADVGIIGRGPSLERAFTSAARAMFGLTTELSRIRPMERVAFDFEEEDVELALVRWLNRLLAEAESRAIALGRFDITREGRRWHGEAWGEPWSARLDRGVDVKGATLTMLSVRRIPGGWEARCVVDV